MSVIKPRLIRTTGLSFAGFLAAFAHFGSAYAAERGLDVTYNLHMGGFHVATAELGVGLVSKCFDVRLGAQPDGLIALFTSFELESRADGCHSDVGVVPDHYVSRYQGKRKRWVSIDYGDGGKSAVRTKPTAREDKRDAVPEQLLAGSVDPMTAAFAITESVSRSGGCSGTRMVYDGRRLFQLELHHGGVAEVKRSRYSVYAGPAIKCRVRVSKVAGFREKEIQKGQFPEEITVFLAELQAGTPMVPVRMEADYRFGRLRGHAVNFQPHPVAIKRSSVEGRGR